MIEGVQIMVCKLTRIAITSIYATSPKGFGPEVRGGQDAFYDLLASFAKYEPYLN